MEKLQILSPWQSYHNKVKALFENDPDIEVVFDDAKPEIKLYVSDKDKADALTKLLPDKKEFGNLTMNITVVPANTALESKALLFQKAFQNNPAFSFVKKTEGAFAFTYVVFKNKVVQYYEDNMGDIYGNRSTLYQELAKEIFGDQNGVFFCTDKE